MLKLKQKLRERPKGIGSISKSNSLEGVAQKVVWGLIPKAQDDDEKGNLGSVFTAQQSVSQIDQQM